MLKYLKLKYILLFTICVWEPLRIFILKFDAANRTIGLLSILTVIVNVANSGFIRTFFKPPVIYWGIWVIYAFINTVSLGYISEHPLYTFFISIITPLMVLWVISAEKFRDRKEIFNIVITGLYIRLIIIVVFETTRRIDVNRLGYYIDSNMIGISALILIIFLYLKYLYKELSLKVLLGLCVMPFYVILATASRNAFGGFTLFLLAHFIINRSKRITHNLATIFIGGFLMFGIFYFVINRTYLGERLTITSEQSTEMKYYYEVQGTIFEKFGDRGYFYIMGFRLFREHPVRGVGLRNFPVHMGIKTVLHSEIMIQLCELGLIGTLLFFLFYFWIGKNLLFCRKHDIDNRKFQETYIAALIIILFLGLSIFQYNDWITFMLTGIIIGNVLYTRDKLSAEEESQQYKK